MMLLRGCCAVSVVPELPEKKRSGADAALRAPNRSVAIRHQRRRAARSLATSSKRSSVVAKWNDRRGPKRSNDRPRLTSDSVYAIAEAMVRPSFWTALHPASRAWYQVIEIGLKRGK